ncbi:MAG: replication-associated recombination protein A [Leptospiraceae bacterium]|nr:replication-associated recombination protein A [Leptospiraceae bacterium]MCP5495557.1 replication-associated recombination protein A [Leptospiraceae bacterium]
MNQGLFSQHFEPLASRLRPKTWQEVIGQEKVKKILQSLTKPVSILLYGPPGTGKTTISKLLSQSWNLPLKSLNAVSSGVKDIKEIIEESQKRGSSFVLFLDEIHRFSSSQQDSLLEAVETGKIILIGATTENPAFRINRPLISRTKIYKLDILNENELSAILEHALSTEIKLTIEPKGKQLLINSSGGDARKILSTLESLQILNKNSDVIDHQTIETLLESQIISYDKNKESHYDFISAFIKSIRGSDPDAALFYLACMLEGGEDPLFIVRRLVILASEDIGNASVQALNASISALHTLEKIGMPEGRIVLAQITTYLASCPKSNASYLALEKATQFVKEYGINIRIPSHIKNAPTFLHKKEGSGKGYNYPHDFPDSFVEENYFPLDLASSPPQFYFPTNLGTEKVLKERLENLWKKTGKKKYDY